MKILITWWTKGIWLAVAQIFAENWYDLVLTYAHDTNNAQLVVDQLSSDNIKVEAIQADSSNKSDIESLFSKVDDISVLVNNVWSSFPHTWPTDREWMFQYHLMSPVRYTEAYANQLKWEWSIINITSVLWNNPWAWHKWIRLEAYCCMKSAVEMYTKICASKYAGKIRVNAVSPWNTKTPSREWADKEFVAQREKNSCINRFIDPSEIAQAVFSLVQNKWITWQSLTVDWGEIADWY